MKVTISTALSTCILAAMTALWATTGKAAPPALVPGERHAFFAHQPAILHFTRAPGWQAPASLTAVLRFGHRTLWQQSCQPDFPLDLDVPMPALKPGLIADLELSLNDNGQPVVAVPVHLFDAKLSEGLTSAMLKLDIGLLAPGDDRAGPALEALGIPFTRVANVTDCKGAWLICSGGELATTPGVADEWWGLLQGGTSILVLPPIAGTAPLLQDANTQLLAAPPRHLRQLDKRLDVDAWTTAAPTIAVRASIVPLGDGAGLAFSTDGTWPWIELKTPTARLIYCGYDIFAHYQENPSAGWLLMNLLVPRDAAARRPVSSLP